MCTEAADGEAAVAAVAADRPDVLLLDVRMPKLTGVEVVETLAARGILPPTLLLTTFEDDAALVAGVRAGARGFLLKAVTAETLVEAIRTVAGGGGICSPRLPRVWMLTAPARGAMTRSRRPMRSRRANAKS